MTVGWLCCCPTAGDLQRLPPISLPQPVVRKQHNSGYKHKANVKSYFTQFEETMQQRQLEAQIRARMVRGVWAQRCPASFTGMPLSALRVWPGLNQRPIFDAR